MAINLATKYAKKVADRFYTESVILGKTSQEYEWDGVKSINIYSIETVDPVDYTRSGTSRYGTVTEVADHFQTLTITQDKAVSLSVDKGNNTQQMMIKNAGKVAALQLREKFVPMFDKYALKKWATFKETDSTDGTLHKTYERQNTVHASLTKTNIVEAVSDHVTALMNAETTIDDANCFMGATNFAKLVLSPEFLNLEKLGGKALGKGVLGQVRGLNICPVPDAYMPSQIDAATGKADVNFMTVKKSCVLAPTQIKDMKIHKDAPGISGALLEMRWLFDAFVIREKAKGVVVDTTAAL